MISSYVEVLIFCVISSIILIKFSFKIYSKIEIIFTFETKFWI